MFHIITCLFICANSSFLASSINLIEATYGSYRSITMQVEKGMKKQQGGKQLVLPLWAIRRLNRESSESQNIIDVIYVTTKKTLQRVTVSSEDAYDPEFTHEIDTIELHAEKMIPRDNNDKKRFIILSDTPEVERLLKARIGNGAWVDITDDIENQINDDDSISYKIQHDAYKDDLDQYDEEDDIDDEDDYDDGDEQTLFTMAKNAFGYILSTVSNFFSNNRAMVIYKHKGIYSIAEARQGNTLKLPKQHDD